MKIGIIGYGKMGKAIEKISINKGYKIIFKINSKNLSELNKINVSKCDVIIEFSNPKNAFKNISFCLKLGAKVISGSTGWTQKLEEAKKICLENSATFLFSENYSLGLNIFLESVQKIASDSNKNKFKIEITETHHISKKDKPSGTALLIKEKISSEKNKDSVKIKSVRTGDVIGDHEIKYIYENEIISLKHRALNRDIFAKGAILAAEFVSNKTGVFHMSDIIKN
tara:strand:- start:145 stop:822 length:678 start_codon:yes stop_codon:yes gene_type:complete